MASLFYCSNSDNQFQKKKLNVLYNKSIRHENRHEHKKKMPKHKKKSKIICCCLIAINKISQRSMSKPQPFSWPETLWFNTSSAIAKRVNLNVTWCNEDRQTLESCPPCTLSVRKDQLICYPWGEGTTTLSIISAFSSNKTCWIFETFLNLPQKTIKRHLKKLCCVMSYFC